MQINLRKADGLQKQLRESMKSLRIHTMAPLNKLQYDTDTVFNKLQTNLNDAISKYKVFGSVISQIRSLVSTQNFKTGINDKLTEIAYIDSLLATYQAVLTSDIAEDISIIKQRVANTVEDDWMQGLSLVSQELYDEISQESKLLKLNRQKLNEEIMALNITTTIELSPNMVEFLEKEMLL